MRWIKFMYEQYIKDIENSQEQMETKIEVSEKELEHLRDAQKLIKTKTNLTTEEPQPGDVYQFENVYYVISDVEEYPYEAFVTSPYWELASDRDLIADGEKQRWVIENLVRYIEDDVLNLSVKIDHIPKQDIKIMQDYIHEGKKLPQEKTGLSYIEGEGFYQELFKENERKRTLFLLPDLNYESEFEIDEEVVINLSQYIPELENMLNQRLAAASFDALIVKEYGDITKEDDNFVIYFNEEYSGTLAKVFVDNILIFEGFLPKKLILKSTLEHPQTLAEVLKIELK